MIELFLGITWLFVTGTLLLMLLRPPVVSSASDAAVTRKVYRSVILVGMLFSVVFGYHTVEWIIEDMEIRYVLSLLIVLNLIPMVLVANARLRALREYK